MLNKTIAHLIKFISIISIITVFSVAYADKSHKEIVDEEVAVLCNNADACPEDNSDKELLNYKDHVEQAKEANSGKTIPLPLDNVKVEEGTKTYEINDLSNDAYPLWKQHDNVKSGDEINISSDKTIIEHYSQDGVQYIAVKTTKDVTDDDKNFMRNHDELATKFQESNSDLKEKQKTLNAAIQDYNAKQAERYKGTTSGYIYGSSSKTDQQKNVDKQKLQEARDAYSIAKNDLQAHVKKMKDMKHQPYKISNPATTQNSSTTAKPKDSISSKQNAPDVSMSNPVSHKTVAKNASKASSAVMKSNELKVQQIVNSSSNMVGDSVMDKANRALMDE